MSKHVFTSMNALPDVLFSKVSIMRLLGFNAHILENGLCRRGEHARKNCEPPRPFSPQMLANFIERIGPEEIEAFFNNVISALAKFGTFPNNRKDFVPKAINVVVVHRWENKEFPPEKGPVFLTNGSVRKPLEVYDRYDDRSIIEKMNTTVFFIWKRWQS
jgi:hypothetical protein